jgi:Trk K+ transport system NAD-binding subunit
LIDTVDDKLAPLRKLGIRTVRGDARNVETYERAGIERDSGVLALTGNDELNLLVAEMVRDEFGIEHPVVVAQRPSQELGRVRMAWVDLLGGRELATPLWYRRLDDGQARLHTFQMADNEGTHLEFREFLRQESADCRLICGWKQGKPLFDVDLERIGELDELTFLATHEAIDQQLTPLAQSEEPAKADGPGGGDSRDDTPANPDQRPTTPKDHLADRRRT